MEVVAADPTPPTPGPAPVDPTRTASIVPAPEQAEPVAAPTPPPEPPRVEAATAPPQPAAPASDDLLGDPSGFFAQSNADAEPKLAPPAGVGAGLPRAPGAGGQGVGALPATMTGPPYELVRTLQSVQDRLAQGAAEALPVQQALRGAIERAFATADDAAWKDRRNVMAAVTYVLSGGAPAVLRALSKMDAQPGVDAQLITGVLAYAEGREKEALERIGLIDPLTLPPSMGAQVAIAQSALVVRTDPERAMKLLGVARLLAPGTLAEEAAIRRQIFIADQLRNDQAVQSLARQYLDRFRHSVYAGNFRARFAAALSHMDFLNNEAEFPRLDDMLASLEPPARVQLYLTVALASAVKSRIVGARLASERALKLAEPGTPDEARAKLYHAAALVAVAKSFDAAASEYGAVDRKLLSPSDAALFDVVGATVASLRSATDRPATVTAAAGGAPDQENPALKKATESLKAVDTLLAAAQ
jgi:chemotaxis protein MotC